MIDLKFERGWREWDSDLNSRTFLCSDQLSDFVHIPKTVTTIWVRLTHRPICADSLFVELDFEPDSVNDEVDGIVTTLSKGCYEIVKGFGNPCWATVLY